MCSSSRILSTVINRLLIIVICNAIRKMGVLYEQLSWIYCKDPASNESNILMVVLILFNSPIVIDILS